MELLLLLAGGVLGWLTNLWFERRALRQSERENEQLRDELARVQQDLSRMRSTILSLGGNEPDGIAEASPAVVGLSDRVAARARQLQDADGRVRSSQLVAHFVAQGLARDEVKASIASLVDDGQIEQEGPWLRPS